MTDEQPRERCTQCEHSFDPHLMVATCADETGGRPDPLKGGIMLCPVRGCLCYRTWGVQGEPAHYIPPQEEIDRIRDQLQSR